MIHHTVPWSEGGPADVDQLLLVCRHHHISVHERGWHIRRDADGQVRVVPPSSRPPPRQE